MAKKAVYDTPHELVTVTLLATGPTLGSDIAVAWLVGFIISLFAVLTC
jgi:hypothetical protein